MRRLLTSFFTAVVPLMALSLAYAAQSESVAVVSTIAPTEAVAPGASVEVTIAIENAHDLGAFTFTLDYDDDNLIFQSVNEGGFLTSTSRQSVCNESSERRGSVTLQCVTLGPDPSAPSGMGVLASVVFEAQNGGTSPLALRAVKLATPPGDEIEASTEDTELVVQGGGGSSFRATALGVTVAAVIAALALLMLRRRRSSR